MTTVPAHITAAMKSAPPSQAPDKLDKVRDAVRRQRDLEHEAEDLEQRMEAVAKELKELQHQTLPDLMDEAQVAGIVLNAEGNLPAYRAELKPYYRANIAADWEPDRRTDAFDYLVEQGAEALIRVTVTVHFGKDQHTEAQGLAKFLTGMGHAPEIAMAVPWATLTAWVRDQVENHKKLPALDTIGGMVGRVVKLKPLRT